MMIGYNVIVVFNENEDKILMCKRRNNPYKGLSNFVGGKIEENEKGFDAAYRGFGKKQLFPKTTFPFLI